MTEFCKTTTPNIFHHLQSLAIAIELLYILLPFSLLDITQPHTATRKIVDSKAWFRLLWGHWREYDETYMYVFVHYYLVVVSQCFICGASHDSNK